MFFYNQLLIGMYLFPFYFYILILEREGEKGGGETETDRYRPVVSPIDAFTVDSCMYPDQGLNLQSRYMP